MGGWETGSPWTGPFRGGETACPPLSRFLPGAEMNNEHCEERAGAPAVADKPFYLPTDERRKATRFQKEPATELVVLWGPENQQYTAEVQNESLGGLAVLLATAADLPVGTQLRLCYAGDSLCAVVRHVELLPDGRQRLGLKCQ